MNLTQPQENYIVNVHGGMTQYEAYLNAYPSSRKWKRATVDKRASELMKNGGIVGRYAELKERVIKKVEVTHDILTNELLKMGLFDIRTIFDEHSHIKDIHNMDETAGKVISSIKTRRVITGQGEDKEVSEIIEIKLNDKGQALDKLAKHIGYFEKDNKLDVTLNVIDPFSDN